MRTLVIASSWTVHFALSAAPIVAHAQVPVVEVGPNVIQNTLNMIQNLTTMLTTLDDLANQTRQLTNQIQILERLIRDGTPRTSAEWGELARALDRLAALVRRGQAIAYSAAALDETFRSQFPGWVPPTDWKRQYDAWSESVLDTLGGVLQSSGANVADADEIQRSLDRLRAENEAAIGQLAAIQTANRVASLEVAELAKLRQLIAAQTNAITVYYATLHQKEMTADAALDRFVNAPGTIRSYQGAFSRTPTLCQSPPCR